MPPELYQTLTQKIQSLDNTVTRVTFPDGVRLNTMKNRILRVAAELNIPVTIRRVPGGLLFWRSPTKISSKPTKEARGSRPPSARIGVALVVAGTLAHEWRAPLDKRGREDTIFRSSGSEGPRLRAGISVGQQPCREELCDGYAASLVSAPCGSGSGRRVC
jgi:hypothetical protein